ncbi:cyclin family protein [Sporobolomyces koalae]|uniref:cyclin family protein n=1 Tax=Sporobolomyces koalae TaxID=500713 RepID=UPI003178A510
MKAPSALPLPAPRASAYPKKRSPSVMGSRRPSPISRRSSPASVEMQRHARMSPAERQLQPLLEKDYRDDVKAYMYEMQSKTMANADLIDQQPELRWYMRSYLVDFLIEIHLQNRLRPETLYLALNIVDRYVSKRIVFKKHYQLVGCAALWIAAKFEEGKDRVPTLPELVEMCCNAYDEKAFIQMEGHVLATIHWVIGHPTAEAWLRLACTTGPLEDSRTQHVSRFIMELTLFHREFIGFYASDIAAASLILARHMLGKSRRILDESETVLRLVLMLDEYLAEHLEDVSHIVITKYSIPEYSRASIFSQQWYLSGRRFAFRDTSPCPSPGPTTPSRPFLARSSSSSISMQSSSSTFDSSSSMLGSTPSHSSMDTSFSSDDSCGEDDEEPLTPATPLPPYSSADPFLAEHLAARLVAGKENQYPQAQKSLVRETHVPAHRPPLNRAKWEVNQDRSRRTALGPTTTMIDSSSPTAASYCS